MIKKNIHLQLLVAMILAILLLLTSCSTANNIELYGKFYPVKNENSKINASNINEEQVTDLYNTEYRAYIHYLYYGWYNSVKDDTLPTLSEINSIAEISDLKEFETDNGTYLYNIYHLENDVSQYDIILMYDYEEKSGEASIKNTFVIDKKYNYAYLDGDEDSAVNIGGIADYSQNLSIENIKTSPTIMRMLWPELVKKNDMVVETDDGPAITTSFVYLTDKGFACVYYDEDYNYAGKFILEEPEIVKLYELYVNYDSNVIE
jgi:hypothetical protein